MRSADGHRYDGARPLEALPKLQLSFEGEEGEGQDIRQRQGRRQEIHGEEIEHEEDHESSCQEVESSKKSKDSNRS